MSSSPLKISVVTAVFNRASTISHAIETVHSQTHPNVEHVVQDGGSSDGTLETIQKANTSNLKLVSTPDTGIYDAINKGISRATGDVIGLMHSDDFFASDTVLEDVARLFADPQVDGVYGDLDYVSASDPTQIIRKWRSGPYDAARFKRGWMPPHPTVYLRRKVFETHGLYDTGFQIAADYDAMLRYMAVGQCHMAYIPKVMVKMRVGGESNRSLSRILQKSREDLRALRSNQVGGVGTLVRKNLSKVTQFF